MYNFARVKSSRAVLHDILNLERCYIWTSESVCSISVNIVCVYILGRIAVLRT